MSKVMVDSYRCLECSNEGLGFYYDVNPRGLPATHTCLMGVEVTGEPGAVRCSSCHSLRVEMGPEVAIDDEPTAKPADSCKLLNVEIRPHPEAVAAGRKAAADAIAKADAREHCPDETGECPHWCPACGPPCEHGENSYECERCKAAKDDTPERWPDVKPVRPLPMKVVLYQGNCPREHSWLCQWADGDYVECHDEQDARYIVTACNAYPAMRARVGELEAELEGVNAAAGDEEAAHAETRRLRDQLRAENERLRSTVARVEALVELSRATVRPHIHVNSLDRALSGPELLADVESDDA